MKVQTEQISLRITQPSPIEIKAARVNAGLTQTEAARLVSSAKSKVVNTWQGYESDASLDGYRSIPLASWELFLLLTDQHPRWSLSTKRKKESSTEKIYS